MVDTPAPKKKGKGIAGLPIWAWGAILAGSVGVYLLYKRYVNDQAAAADSATTDENTAEPLDTGASSTTSNTPAVYSTFSAWEQAALSAMTGPNYNAAQALNDLSAWTNGECVSSAGYNAIGNILETVGLPPGFGSSTPTLAVCADSGTTSGGTTGSTTGGTTSTTTAATTKPPGLSASLQAAMTNNGEHVTDTVYDATTKTWLYLTNKGGVYALNNNGGTTGATFYGSYLGLPAKDTEGGSRTFNQIQVNSNGTYSLIDTLGQVYNFTPTTQQKPTTSTKTPVKTG